MAAGFAIVDLIGTLSAGVVFIGLLDSFIGGGVKGKEQRRNGAKMRLYYCFLSFRIANNNYFYAAN